MASSDERIEAVDAALTPLAVRFLAEWVTADEAAARDHLADHPSGEGSSLVALVDGQVVGIVTLRWRARYAGFRDHGIPLLHQLSVAEPFRRRGVASVLMDRAEQLARDRDATTIGITVGLFDAYGAAQRMYARRGYVPDGRGVCLGAEPVPEGTPVVVGHDLILWLTKDLGPADCGTSVP